MTTQDIHTQVRQLVHSIELDQRADFFGRWLNVLNLTPVMDKLDKKRTINEAEAIVKRKHYGRKAY